MQKKPRAPTSSRPPWKTSYGGLVRVERHDLPARPREEPVGARDAARSVPGLPAAQPCLEPGRLGSPAAERAPPLDRRGSGRRYATPGGFEIVPAVVGQAPRDPAVGSDDHQLVVVAERAPCAVGDHRAVRRPRRLAVGLVGPRARDAAPVRAVRAHRVDVRAIRRLGREGDSSPVGRPRRLLIVGARAGQRRGAAPVSADQMEAPLVGYRARERDPAVRPPCRVAVGLVPGQPPRRPTVGGRDEHSGAEAEEHDPGAVRRPGGRGIEETARPGDGARAAAVRRRHEDLHRGAPQARVRKPVAVGRVRGRLAEPAGQLHRTRSGSVRHLDRRIGRSRRPPRERHLPVGRGRVGDRPVLGARRSGSGRREHQRECECPTRGHLPTNSFISAT